MHDEIDAEVFHPARARDAIVGGKIVAHHLHAEIAPGIDDAPDRRLVRAAHDDDEIGAGLRHHLRFEVPAVHRLQIGDDGVIGKALRGAPRTARSPSARSSGVPASSQSTPASTAIAAVSSASSSE